MAAIAMRNARENWSKPVSKLKLKLPSYADGKRGDPDRGGAYRRADHRVVVGIEQLRGLGADAPVFGHDIGSQAPISIQ